MKYTEEQHQFMHDFVPGHAYEEIRREFIRKFGFDPGKHFPKSYIGNHRLNTGRTGRFEKGSVPANKGKKMSRTTYNKCKGTMFKSGNTPQNTDPVGTEKLLADGYIWVKIDNKAKVPKKENWKQKHRLIWEKENGEIPPGYVVTFLDGNKRNCDINNLRLITRAQNVRMNQNGLYKENPEATESGILISKLMSEIGKKDR